MRSLPQRRIKGVKQTHDDAGHLPFPLRFQITNLTGMLKDPKKISDFNIVVYVLCHINHFWFSHVNLTFLTH
jgi:hypothetical protein